MSASEINSLLFSMSYDDLIKTSIEKEAFLSRDEAELAARGVTTAKITALAAKRTAFTALPDNEASVENNSLGYQARDKQSAILFTAIELVGGIALDTFGVKSAQYIGFELKGLGLLDANALFVLSGNIVLKGNKYMSQMSPKGLTAPMLANVTTQAAALLPFISAIPVVVGDGKTSTVTRRTEANDFFLTLKGLCGTGKAFYRAAKNSVKTKDYAIYDKAKKVVDRTGKVKSTKSVFRITASVVANTRIRLKVKSGTSLLFYYGMTRTSAPTAPAAIVDYNPNIFFKTTASSLGYNLAGGIIYLIIYNPNADDADFLAKIG